MMETFHLNKGLVELIVLGSRAQVQRAIPKLTIPQVKFIVEIICNFQQFQPSTHRHKAPFKNKIRNFLHNKFTIVDAKRFISKHRKDLPRVFLSVLLFVCKNNGQNIQSN